MIIGFCGAAGAGKTTAARYLHDNFGYHMMSFAGPMKRSVCKLLDVNPDDLEELKNGHGFIWWSCRGVGSTFSGRFTWREFLQRYGTEAHREVFGDDFWVNQFDKSLISIDRDVVVDDVRFPNERDFILKNGGVVIEILRSLKTPDKNADTHPSAKRLDNVPRMILNDGTKENLYAQLEMTMRALSREKLTPHEKAFAEIFNAAVEPKCFEVKDPAPPCFSFDMNDTVPLSMLSIGAPYLVRWDDTASVHGWVSEFDDDGAKKLMASESVGFLVQADANAVILCQSKSPELASEHLCIPRGAVKAIIPMETK